MPSEIGLLIYLALWAGLVIGIVLMAEWQRRRLRAFGSATFFAKAAVAAGVIIFATSLLGAGWSGEVWLYVVGFSAILGLDLLDPTGRFGPLLVHWRHGLFGAWRPLLQLQTEPPTPERIAVARRQLARLDRWRRPETEEFIDLWHEAMATWEEGRSGTPEGLARIPRLRELSEELYPPGVAPRIPDA